MKKSFLIMFIAFITLISTACVNRFAVQELNNHAKELLSQGKTEAAIARLESSIDLDDEVFETHYNLAVAYMQAKMYDKALASLEKVKELNPDFPDTYHSIAVCNEEKANAIISGEDKAKEIQNEQNDDDTDNKELSPDDKAKVTEYYTNAIDNYNTYLTKKEKAEDKDKVEQKINELNNQIKNFSSNENMTENSQAE